MKFRLGMLLFLNIFSRAMDEQKPIVHEMKQDKKSCRAACKACLCLDLNNMTPTQQVFCCLCCPCVVVSCLVADCCTKSHAPH